MGRSLRFSDLPEAGYSLGVDGPEPAAAIDERLDMTPGSRGRMRSEVGEAEEFLQVQ